MDFATYENCPVNHDDWLKKRRTGIGGSDAAAVCGISPYRSAIEVWLEKKGRLEPQTETEPLYWGQILEPVVREEFTKRTGLTVYRINKILRHVDYPFMTANLDGIVYDPEFGPCVFEAKTASAFKASQWDKGVPDDYVLQCSHYLAVTGYLRAYVSVLIGGSDFRIFTLNRDDALIATLIDIEKQFWGYVETDTPPPIDGSDASTRLMTELYPIGQKNTVITLPDYAQSIVHDYIYWKTAEKNATTNKQLAENQLKELLEDNEVGHVQGVTVKWNNVSTSRLDTELLKKEQPDLFSQYQKTTISRRFSLKGEMGNE